MVDQTVNFPQLVLIIVLGAIAIRYFFFSAGPTSSQSRRSNSTNNVRAREEDVERIQQMFPQVQRRTIMWDLQRNGGSVVATTERVLSGRGLEVPPQSFQPPLPVSASSAISTSAQSKPSQPDLITRYNLQAKLAEEASKAEGSPAEEVASTGKQKPGQAWSANKGERQALLQRRREEMILAARKKMEASIAAESVKETQVA
ncbi:hypothetical protein QTJ16_004570 [Diplocarpon rosae]|uniref:Coupling of ubiquitin conjugation to ER degradation protein 1 n=1 Tax=Diplocarpon rosae TaxID=946125 RepID=A0AAD9T027_9HELO|nr:hypothetical protein QTJ16_004570 [Diplocarpon rosae]PBP26106.1 CUE domain-containing protein [Diplocarpon rosae]